MSPGGQVFVGVFGIAVVSLIATFVLFRFLESHAEASGAVLHQQVRYGGALAGFVIVFGILFGSFWKLNNVSRLTTPIELDGTWKARVELSDGEVGTGTVEI